MCLCYLFSAKTACQLVNRKADFLLNESIRIDSHNESNRFESRIGMLYCAIVHQLRSRPICDIDKCV